MFDRLAGAFKDLELKWKSRTPIQSYTPALMRPQQLQSRTMSGMNKRCNIFARSDINIHLDLHAQRAR